MNADKRFTLRLADGREAAFDDAAALVAWLGQQRGLEYRHGRHRPKAEVRRQPRSTDANNNEAPLARYANRYSSEA